MPLVEQTIDWTLDFKTESGWLIGIAVLTETE